MASTSHIAEYLGEGGCESCKLPLWRCYLGVLTNSWFIHFHMGHEDFWSEGVNGSILLPWLKMITQKFQNFIYSGYSGINLSPNAPTIPFSSSTIVTDPVECLYDFWRRSTTYFDNPTAWMNLLKPSMQLVEDGPELLMCEFVLWGSSQYLGLVVKRLGYPPVCLIIVGTKLDWATLEQ